MQTSYDDRKVTKGTWGSKDKKIKAQSQISKKKKKKSLKGDNLNSSMAENFVDNHSSALASSKMSHIGPM